MAHQAITSTISTCLSINPCLGLQHKLLSDKLLAGKSIAQAVVEEGARKDLFGSETEK
jgi:hypothetical protein